MKKTLLAAALLAGFAGAASAQSSVTLYGVLDGGLRYSSVSLANGDGVSNFGGAYGVQSGNRWGMKGVESLGNGNNAMFQIESGFDMGNGAGQQGGRLFGRASWVGLQNNAWGDVRLGRMTNLTSDWMVGGLDPFAAGFGQLNMGHAFTSGNTVRLDNTLMYRTPNMSGFQAGLGYSFATGLTSNGGTTGYGFATSNNSRQITAGLKYANGPFYAAATYEKAYAAESTRVVRCSETVTCCAAVRSQTCCERVAQTSLEAAHCWGAIHQGVVQTDCVTRCESVAHV